MWRTLSKQLSSSNGQQGAESAKKGQIPQMPRLREKNGPTRPAQDAKGSQRAGFSLLGECRRGCCSDEVADYA
jgi:hypothetical protein